MRFPFRILEHMPMFEVHLINTSAWCSRTKWKRQTAVGMELLAETSNYTAVQRMLRNNSYWFTYHPQAAAILSNFDAFYLRAHSTATSSNLSPSYLGHRQLMPRVLIHGLQQHINRIPPLACASSMYDHKTPRS